MDIKIRQEVESDWKDVYNVILQAFEKAEHTDHKEHILVERLRKSQSFIPELSLVAERNGEIIGHILFTKIQIGKSTQLALAPLSVLPSMQRKGIGCKLILTGHEIARNLGYEFSVVLGHEKYYPRFGYQPASLFGIRAPFDVPVENFMAVHLQGNCNKLDGIVQYDSAFFAF